MILLSGATGRVGTAVSQALYKAGVPFRVLIRNPEKFTLPKSDKIELCIGNLEDTDAIRESMKGVTKALLLTGNGQNQASIEKNFSDLAASSGVQHIVKISSLEASAEATATLPKMHYESEQHIVSTGLKWTFIRPNFYMQNLFMYSASIAKAGVFSMPLGEAKTGIVDARDVGAVCAKILQEEGHENTLYQLTGPDLITFTEVAAKMSETLGKPITYHHQTAGEFRSMLEKVVQASTQLDAICELFAEIADGALEKITPDIRKLLDREPVSIEQFTKDFSAAF